MSEYLQKVTITGADDSVAVPHLVDLSLEFPFVEWGILVSARQEGGYRFPSRHWIDRLSAVAPINSMNVSTHVCGRWVREMFVGSLTWASLPSCVEVAQRIQINTHAEPHVSTTALMGKLAEKRGKQFIFQWDGVNDHLTHAANAYGLNVAALFDTSSGAGILPSDWPKPTTQFWCGYAGGLGPANVADQVAKIETICRSPYWIDMERRVRTEDDSALDMSAVRSVLETCAALIATGVPA